MTGSDLIPVFVGPSLPPTARPEGPFQWLPPAQAGDLTRLLKRPPARLCLIDGLFDSCPSPWHKELLMLMARGTTVFGAASMGALRAAELSRFGMIGIGVIYRAYATDRLCGDDEVALIHATERLGWAPLTVPMVEFRATLVQACRSGLIEVAVARRLRSAAKAIHFSDRDWPVIASMGEKLTDPATLAMLERMHVPLKRRDALACLAEAMRTQGAPSFFPDPPLTCFIRDLLEFNAEAYPGPLRPA